jgi:hypothetical protein
MERTSEMPHYIIHHNGAYNFYTTIEDGAVFASALTLKQLESYYQEEYGKSGMRELPVRLKRAQEIGTSSRIHDSLRECILCNRAGENESTLSFDEFVAEYLTLPKRKDG